MQQNNEIPVCACFRLRKASRAISLYYDSFLSKAGLKNTQYVTLKITSMTNKITITDIGKRLGLEQSTVTRNVDLLNKNGLVQISNCSTDARKKQVVITSKAKQLLQEADKLWIQAHTNLKQGLGEEKFETLIASLEQVEQTILKLGRQNNE